MQTQTKRGRDAESRDLRKHALWDFRASLPVCFHSSCPTFPLRVRLCSPSLKLSHAGVHCLHGPQPEEGQWGPQQAERHQPQRGEPSQGQVPHCGHHRSQLWLLHPAPHLTQGVNGEAHGHEVQVCVCTVLGLLTELTWKTVVLLFFC